MNMNQLSEIWTEDIGSVDDWMDDDKGSKVIKSRDTGIRRNLGRKDKIRKPPPNHSILCDRSNSTRQHSQLYSFKILIILVLIIYISMSLGRFFFFFFFQDYPNPIYLPKVGSCVWQDVHVQRYFLFFGCPISNNITPVGTWFNRPLAISYLCQIVALPCISYANPPVSLSLVHGCKPTSN